ncbi:hypothetical protein BASA81_013999 [Batrachochytrium salamandrivorans]|nr:hypothetical protein BASA81_013999 [Batrachochytrium salamandrivorans]
MQSLPILETSSATLVSENGFELDQVNQYILLGRLGFGGSGEVFECQDEITQIRYAIKCFPHKSILRRKLETIRVGRKMTEVGNAFQDLLREVAIMKKTDHENLVKLIEIINDSHIDRLFMILELVEGGPIMDWDHHKCRFLPNPLLSETNTTQGLSLRFSKKCMRDCIRGLDYLHHNQIIHLDLKPQNLLYCQRTNTLKIADFGASLALDTLNPTSGDEQGMIGKQKGTAPFFAPELCEKARKFDGYKADVWALGVCFFCFETGTLPFYDSDRGLLFDQIRHAPLPLERLGSDTGDGKLEMAKLLLERDPKKRPVSACALMDLHFAWLGKLERDVKSFRNIQVTEDEMVNALSTLHRVHGFAKIWRRKTIASIKLKHDAELLALAALTGTTSGSLLNQESDNSLITASSQTLGSLRKLESGDNIDEVVVTPLPSLEEEIDLPAAAPLPAVAPLPAANLTEPVLEPKPNTTKLNTTKPNKTKPNTTKLKRSKWCCIT